MYTLGGLAKSLNRPVVLLTGLQARFELPVLEGSGYSEAYLAFLRQIVHLRALGVAEESLHGLWHLEKKLMRLLHMDASESPTWFLDSCGRTTRADRRLLLSGHDLGFEIHSQALQPGLDLTPNSGELFEGAEMGEDLLRVLDHYRQQLGQIQKTVSAELPQVRAAARWAQRRLLH